jgi:Polyketide cyclase / dehydrase and lipid transport
MASIHEEIQVQRAASDVWSAVADTGAVQERLARDFVTDCCLEGDIRTVTFSSGAVARELLVDVNAETKRLAYSVVDSPLGMRHHHASIQVVPEGDDRCRIVWIADLTPDDAASAVEGLMRAGCIAMRDTLEGAAAISSGDT